MIDNSGVIKVHLGYVVLTGGLGFIGRTVSLLFAKRGWKVICLIRPESNLAPISIHENIEFIRYDNAEDSLSKLKKLPVNHTVFIHLAAFFTVDNEIEGANLLLQSNVEYGLNLTKFMIKNGFKKFIYAESYWQFDEYGNVKGNCIYAITKSAFSLIVEHLSKKSLNSISLVLYDVYGPNDPRGKLINRLLTQTLSDDPVELSEGNQLIDYIHVDDVASAFFVASELILNEKNSVGFARHTVRSMRPMILREYVKLAADAVNKSLNIRWGGTPYPSHQILNPWLPADSIQLPGWKPIVEFEDGVRGLISGD